MKIAYTPTTRAQLTIGLIYAGIGVLGFGLAHIGEPLLRFIPRCLFRLWSGLPCPTCGATRTGIELSHFHIAEAFLENPLFFLLFTALFFWGMNTVIGVVTGKNIKIDLTKREKKLVRILLLSAILLNWLYLVLRTILDSYSFSC